MAILTTEGKQHILGAALGKVTPSAFIVRLGKNDVTPTTSSVLTDFVEADFSGYSEVVTDHLDWAISTILVEGVQRVTISHPTVEFISNLDGQFQSIYTAYVVTQVGGVLVAADRFNSGHILSSALNNGDKKVATMSISITDPVV